MHNSTAQFPIDFKETPQFRRMENLFGAVNATFIFAMLWRDLGYKAKEGTLPGLLPKDDAPLFVDSLTPVETDNEKRSRLFNALVDPVKLLVKDGDNFVCPLFANLNASMRNGPKMQSLGGNIRAFNLGMKRAEATAFQQALLLDSEKFVDADEQPLDADAAKRVVRLVLGCDNALFKGERPQWAFSKTMIQSAASVVRMLSDDEIDSILRTIALHRGHVVLNGMTAEKLIPQFKETYSKLKGGADGEV